MRFSWSAAVQAHDVEADVAEVESGEAAKPERARLGVVLEEVFPLLLDLMVTLILLLEMLLDIFLVEVVVEVQVIDLKPVQQELVH